ncbi:MAG TPA: hypothetical protein VGJ75_04635 [Dongiaceae bacterium]|jgi:hypothetical protein
MALELHQTRNLTPAELSAVSRDWSLLLHRRMGRSIYYTVMGYLTWTFIGFLAISIAMAAFALDDPELKLQLIVAFVGMLASWITVDRITRRLQQRIYWDRYRTSDRYALDDRGIRTTTPDGEHLLLWQGIAEVADGERRCVILTNSSGAAFVVKAAFDGQDADGFCAELQRRWKNARA